MAALSTIGRSLLALLLVLWQPICLCDIGGGHAHGSESDRSTHDDGAHDHAEAVGHAHTGGDHHGDEKNDPCDHAPGGCECSKGFLGSLNSSQGTKGGTGDFAPLAFLLPSAYVVQTIDTVTRVRGVNLQDRSPPPLSILYCVLRI